jgi:hypothetical protein
VVTISQIGFPDKLQVAVGSDLGCPILMLHLKTIVSAAVKGGPKERKKDNM